MPTQREREQKEERMADASQWATEQGKFESTSVDVSKFENVEFYKLEEGQHEVDFMPYIVGEGNPRADKGFVHFDRQWTAHSLPNSEGKERRYVCANGSFKKPCRVCRWRSGPAAMSDAKVVANAKPKERHLFLLNVNPGQKPGTKKNPWKVLDANDWNRGKGFRELLVEAIEQNHAKYGKFYDLKKGFKVRFSIKEQPAVPGGIKAYNAVTRIDFLERDYEYDAELLKAAPCLDDMLVRLSSAKVDELLGTSGGDADADAEDDAPPRKRRPVEDDADGDEAPPPKKKKPVAEDEDDAPPPRKKPAAADDDEDAPPPKKKKPVAEDEGDDDPPPRKKPAAAAEDDDDAPQFEEGDLVQYEYKGKTVVGKYVKVNRAGIASVKVPGRSDDAAVHISELSKAKKPKPADDEEEDAPPPKKPGKKPPVDEDDDAPPPKKPSKKPAPAADDEDDEKGSADDDGDWDSD